MTTITRERLKQIYAECEERDPAIFEIRELVRIALASLEAEPIGYMNCFTGRVFSLDEQPGADTDTAVYEPVYAAPPAPVVPDVLERLRIIVSDPRALPRRKEWISGQQYSYVLLENVDAMVEEACRAAMLKTEPATAPVISPDLHPDTQKLVTDFCTALAEKLYKAQLKYGYDADWKKDNWSTQCLSHFHQHIAKGDPRDVAAYCAFMWYHGWKTEPVSGPVVPEEMPKGLAAQIVSLLAHNIGDKLLAQKIWNACRAVMLQSKYRDLSQPVDPQISEYEKIMGQAGNSPVIPDGYALVPVEPTDEMIEAAMNCEDVLFNSDESFCVQFGNIYEAMLAAAPQQEQR